MRKGWDVKTLDSICWAVADIDHNMPKAVQNGIPFISAKDITDNNKIDFSNTKFISQTDYERLSRKIKPQLGDIIYTRIGTIGKAAIVVKEIQFLPSYSCCTIRPKEEFINSDFLLFYLKSEIAINQAKHGANGAGVPDLGMKVIKNFEIPLPTLTEQQRIVSIIDKCFTAIDQAKSIAEQNLKNAKELFESYLNGVFENKGDDWEEKNLENCFKMKSGDNLTAKNMSEGEYPVFGGNGIAGYHNDYNLSGSNVIIGRVGALCGNVRHITEHIWLTDNAFKIVDFKFEFDHSFLTYLLNHKELRSYARQAAQPVISNSSLKDVVLHFPKSKEKQEYFVSKLDSLQAETKKLEEQYKKKIEDLEELKKSILTKAFSGEL